MGSNGRMAFHCIIMLFYLHIINFPVLVKGKTPRERRGYKGIDGLREDEVKFFTTGEKIAFLITFFNLTGVSARQQSRRKTFFRIFRIATRKWLLIQWHVYLLEFLEGDGKEINVNTVATRKSICNYFSRRL